MEVRNWELSVFVFRWGWLDELEESFSRAGKSMTWTGQPELLSSQHQDGAKRGAWTVPTVFERDEEGESEAVSLGLLKQTGLPINPDRFAEVSAEQ